MEKGKLKELDNKKQAFKTTSTTKLSEDKRAQEKEE